MPTIPLTAVLPDHQVFLPELVLTAVDTFRAHDGRRCSLI